MGVADLDPAKAGRDLGEIIGEGRLGMPIDIDDTEMLSRARPEVAVVCTSSAVAEVVPTIETCLEHGSHVVTTCENLIDPDAVEDGLPDGLDARARQNGVVILATGVNPGFAMDRLPILLSKATRNVRRVRVVRVVDAATRRAQLQMKAGIGMKPRAFSDAMRKGRVGHAGLLGSLRLVAKGLGVVLDKTTESLRPIVS